MEFMILSLMVLSLFTIFAVDTAQKRNGYLNKDN
jgi:hypothetical protein